MTYLLFFVCFCEICIITLRLLVVMLVSLGLLGGFLVGWALFWVARFGGCCGFSGFEPFVGLGLGYFGCCLCLLLLYVLVLFTMRVTVDLCGV